MVRRKLYPVAAVVHSLNTELGVGVQWTDKLNDFRQDRTDMKGLMLLPVGRARGTPTHASEPRYRVEDIAAFIKQVREAYGCTKPFPLVVDTYEYDEDDAALMASTWRHRRLIRVSHSPAARKPIPIMH